jgi:very-short-patch-repair endonuclease
MKTYKKENVEFARSLRKDMTPWEKKLWYTCLREYKVRFQRQKMIGNYIVDFYCAGAALVIELDGSPHYEEKGKKYDAQRDAYLNEQGLQVLRICDKEIETNFDGVRRIIDETVKKRKSEMDRKKKK